MALENNTQVNHTDKNTIKNWFKTGLKPTQAQFWATWDSYWHKSESLPISAINGLGNFLDAKSDINHGHNEYATNDATSLNKQNIISWQEALGIANLEFDDNAISITSDYSDFGVPVGAKIKAFNDAVYNEVNKKLNAPTENNTEEYVLLADGSTAAKADFGRVNAVNNKIPYEDGNGNVNVDLNDILKVGNTAVKPIVLSINDFTTRFHQGGFDTEGAGGTLTASTQSGFSFKAQKGVSNGNYVTFGGSFRDLGIFYTNGVLNHKILLPSEINNNITQYFPTRSGTFAMVEDVEEVAQFLKNGLGWSTKYKVTNPGKYRPTGENAVDLSIAYPNSTELMGASGKDSFASGSYTVAGGISATAMGFSSKAYTDGSVAIGYTNRVYSKYATVVGGHGNTIGFVEELTTPTLNLNTRASIFGGGSNKIIRGDFGTILGGGNNTIDMLSVYSPTNRCLYNTIVGGYTNNITDATTSTILGGVNNFVGRADKISISDSLIGGSNNTAQGSYTTVFGYKNTGVTQGETLFGMLATIQDTSLEPTTYYNSSRVLGIGIGTTNAQGVVSRKDGLNVYNSGLVLAPSVTNSLIDSNPKALVTKEWVDNKVTASEFLKITQGANSGYGTKYRAENPDLYTPIGNNALDLSYATSFNLDPLFKYGAGGNYSMNLGYINRINSTGLGTLVAGVQNTSSGQTNHIIGYRSTISEDRGTANKGKYSNGVFAGENQTIANSTYSVLIGGSYNKITGDAEPKTDVTYNKGNAILGGGLNEIFSPSTTNRPAFNSVIIGGESNKAQGYYNVVGGYGNHAVTITETLFGIYATIQDTALNGYDFIDSSRIFAIGVGEMVNDSIRRRDGLSVYRNGLVLAPSLTKGLIDSNPKSLVTNEWVTTKIGKYYNQTEVDAISTKIVGITTGSNALEKYRLDECSELLNQIKTNCGSPLVTPLEYIDGTYVKKSITGGKVIYEPTEYVNATNIIKQSVGKDTVNCIVEGVLFKVFFKEYPQVSVMVKSGLGISPSIVSGGTLCFEEVLTGVITEITFTDLTPPYSPTNLVFIGGILYGVKDKKSKIEVSDSDGLSIHGFEDAQNNINDTYFKLDLSSKNLVKGSTYNVSVIDTSGNRSAQASVIY